MTAVASLVLGLSLVGQCAQDAPGPGCPRNGVVHEMIATVGGASMRFTGWHDSDGRRKYLPEGNPEFHAATMGQGAVGATLPGKNYGVNLATMAPGQSGTIRTNDALVGAALNSSLAERPCPPEVCPNPLPGPDPAPSPSHSHWVVIGLGVVLSIVAFLVFVGALIVGFFPRKATS